MRLFDGGVPVFGASRCSPCGSAGSQVESSTLKSSEAEGVQDGLGELDAGDDLVFDLAGGAEDVGVVLGEAADAEQAVHGAGAFVAVNVT